MLVSVQHEVRTGLRQRDPGWTHMPAIPAMQAGGEDRVMPHGHDAAAITLDTPQLLFQPDLLLLQGSAAQIAVQANHPPVTDQSPEPRAPRRAGAEIVEEVRRRAGDVIVIARDGVGP